MAISDATNIDFFTSTNGFNIRSTIATASTKMSTSSHIITVSSKFFDESVHSQEELLTMYKLLPL